MKPISTARFYVYLLLAWSVVLTGCAQPEPASHDADIAATSQPVPDPQSLVSAPSPTTAVGATPSAAPVNTDSSTATGNDTVEIQRLVAANNQFGLDLYHELKGLPGNLFFSPHSIATAMTMTYAGARSRTASQMASTLRLPDGNVHAAAAQLHKNLMPATDSYQLAIANRLWSQMGLPLQDEFLRTTREDYLAELATVDFVGATEQARLAINSWVNEQTSRKIPELIAANAISPATRLVLTNAVYFKGTWVQQFDKTLSQQATFFGPEPSQVPLMYQRGDFGYKETNTFQALRMPYAGDALSMVILLPRARNGLAELEDTAIKTGIAGMLADMSQQEIDVWLPRFAASSQFKLNKILMQLGMIDAFSPAQADFSGITGTKELHVTEAIHQAFVEVNEEGSEAAAATAVVMGIERASRIISFRADHPFVFMIVDNQTGTVLFLGRLIKPA